MKHPIERSLGLLGLVAVLGALVYISLGRVEAPAARPSSAAAPPGYPPPASATPPATATADPQGYLPPPADQPWSPTSLMDDPHAALLEALQAAFDEGDAAWPASGIADDRGGLLLAPLEQLDSEGGQGLRAPDAESLLEAYFAAGASPRIQGYFDRGACLDVLIHRMPAPLALPPTPVSESGAAYGRATPAQIEAEAAALRFCDTGDGSWVWNRWIYADYADLLAWGKGAQGPPGATYHVLRP